MHILSKYRRFAWVFVFALFVRSLLPVGYMPDFSGSHFKLILCDGTDHTTVSADSASGSQHPEGCPHHHGGPCPFSVGAIYTLNSTAIPILPPFVFAAPAHSTQPQTPLEQLAIFAGSARSPPRFS